jgi:hypothetical protein
VLLIAVWATPLSYVTAALLHTGHADFAQSLLGEAGASLCRSVYYTQTLLDTHNRTIIIWIFTGRWCVYEAVSDFKSHGIYEDVDCESHCVCCAVCFVLYGNRLVNTVIRWSTVES